MKIYPARNLVLNEFEKIKELVEAICISAPGRKLIKDVVFSSDFEQVSGILMQVKEFKKITDNGEDFPIDGFIDITKDLQLLMIPNSVLFAESFLSLLNFTRGVKRIYGFFEKKKVLYPVFYELSAQVGFEPVIISVIEDVLDDYGTVKSSASPDLGRIRRVLAKKRSEAEKLYQTIIHKYNKNGWISDTKESMRNGRRVISIFAEQKRTLRGIVHDISATGKTVFIEPEETIGINNDLYDLEQEEKREIWRILKTLTSTLRPYQNVLTRYANLVAICDSTRAKALFARTINAGLPILVRHSIIDLKNATHPLLFLYNKSHQKPTIPFSLRLDKSRILVISGPNAGGKTVCMKTIGLAQLMLQSGFLIPADENSTMGIFEKLMVDLGDSQSIEFELSTYSSRLMLMKSFIEEGNKSSLFLIDEFGTGTDPNLGGALAEAVLEELNRKGLFGIITTHYLNLKLMAERTPGVINGSMAFALKELKPLYHLIIGKPGSSYTFVVAERSGLPKSIIQSATQKIDRKSFELEKLLNKVEKEKNTLQEKMSLVTANEKKLNELIKKYSIMHMEAENAKTTTDKRLKDKEARLTEDMNRMFKGFMKEWKLVKNKKQLIERFSKQLEIKYNKIAPEKTRSQAVVKTVYEPSIFKPGTLVTLNGGKAKGKIESIDGNKARVLFGDFYTLCSLSDLIPADTG